MVKPRIVIPSRDNQENEPKRKPERERTVSQSK
jgi:hypothetical protein